MLRQPRRLERLQRILSFFRPTSNWKAFPAELPKPSLLMNRTCRRLLNLRNVSACRFLPKKIASDPPFSKSRQADDQSLGFGSSPASLNCLAPAQCNRAPPKSSPASSASKAVTPCIGVRPRFSRVDSARISSGPALQAGLYFQDRFRLEGGGVSKTSENTPALQGSLFSGKGGAKQRR